MPQRAAQFPFEWKVFAWANTFSSSLAMHYNYAFFVEFTSAGSARRVIFGEQPRRFDRAELEKLEQQSVSYLFYDPFDAPESAFLTWQAVKRTTLERLLGEKFSPEDFVSEGETMEYPESWGVMF